MRVKRINRHFRKKVLRLGIFAKRLQSKEEMLGGELYEEESWKPFSGDARKKEE